MIKLNRSTTPAILIGLAALLHFLGLTDTHDWGGDFAQYLMQAKSLVDNRTLDFIVSNAFTINESSTPPGPVAYPWGFPLLLAPIYALVGMDLIAFKLIVLVFYILFLLALYVGLRQRLSTYALVKVLSLFAFSPFLMRFNDEILSDIPFLFFSTVALLIINNLPFYSNHNDSGASQARKRQAILSFLTGMTLGLMIFGAFLIRTNGILLLPTLLIALLGSCGISSGTFAWTLTGLRAIKFHFFSQGRAYFLTAVFLIFLILYWLATIYLPDGQSSHLNHLDQVSVRQLLNHFFYYLILPAEFFSPNSSRLVGLPIYLVTLPFCYLGIKKYWQDNIGFCAYFALTFVMYVIWPHKQGLRFFLSIMPVYVYFFVLGVESAQTRFYRLNPTSLPKVIVAMFIIASAYIGTQNILRDSSQYEGPYSADSTEMFDFIRSNTTASDVVIFRKPRVMALMTERPSVRITQEKDIAKLKGICFLVQDSKNPSGQLPERFVQEKILNDSFALIFENNQFKIYKVTSR